ncbi:TonB-dependent receptor [Flavicella sediminum]|uniref:TonB-dependent receptor n=1 Tax=Flavicella sediminum TaxID=2585141 RepID=UPI0011202564|nr:TonB-dependent receptor [Flavicella sediminum]
MKKILFILFLVLAGAQTYCQTKINGNVVDVKGNPIVGVNIYLEGTYDGTMSDENGSFEFSTSETGTQKLRCSFISYETKIILKKVSEMKGLKIKLREDVSSLDAVVLAAGTFNAGDNSKVTALKPLDVVTTASALGDPIAAFQTMPGTSTVAEDGRLFVRGGTAEETQIFIDGIRVFTPYAASANNTPTRGRYSPFLFDGMTFSTGGYSAEYGQALSGVLLLNTINTPEQEKTDIGIMSVGGAVGNTQIWCANSLSVNTSYINLKPYLNVFEDRNKWVQPFQVVAGEAVYRRSFSNGLLKLYTAFDSTNFELIQEDINVEEGISFKLKNHNFYLNSSYKGVLSANWSVLAGLSFTAANSAYAISKSEIENKEESIHAKLKFNRFFSNRFQVSFGADYFLTDFDEFYKEEHISEVAYGFQNKFGAVYGEFNVFFSKSLALKGGIRAGYHRFFERLKISPRVSLAYKTAENSQVSLAYGDFYQNPTNAILKFEQDLKTPKSQHYIVNYQYNNDGKILRTELYAKKYLNLVKYDTELPQYNSHYTSNGTGYAKGLDVFWRDNKSIKNVDYWFSYSYLDSQRDFKNYEKKAQPNFVNKHNISLVAKYWLEDWKSQVGLSYNFASGRTYTDPNKQGFLNQKTKAYHSLSLNWAYLISQQKILYFSLNNALGTKNINGYQFANNANDFGQFEKRALRPAADRFFFVGFFWTISEKGTDNQLDKL